MVRFRPVRDLDPKEIDGIPEDDSNVVLHDLYACAHVPKTQKYLKIFDLYLKFILSIKKC